jgi:HAMP domain-containing protein
MLDFDLAEIYQVETRAFNQQVRRNIKRFPPDFMFQLTMDEWKSMSSQFVMTSRLKRPKSSLPLAFTEHGATMSATVLNSDVAIEKSILIVRAFVALRQFLLNPPIDEVKELQNEVRQLKEYVEDAFADYNDVNEDTRMELELINRTLADLQSKTKWLDNPNRPHLN